MTDRTLRLYAVVIAALVFCIAWAVVAARPWATTKTDPRLVALAVREQRLRADAKLVRQIVDQRTATYKTALAVRQAQNTAARSLAAVQASGPAVRVVNLPPLTITKSS